MPTRVYKGKPVNPAVNSRRWYEDRLRLLVDVMDGRMKIYFKRKGGSISVAYKESLSVLRAKFVALFEDEAKPLAMEFFNRNITYTKAAFRTAIKPVIEAQEKDLQARKRKGMAQAHYAVKIDGRRDKLELAQFRESIEENVDLIKSIPRQYFTKVEMAVEAHSRGKMSRGALVKRLKDIGGITQRRAEMIADDQTAKSCEKMMIARCKKAGVTKVMWVHSGISKIPRDYHLTRWDGHSGKRNGKPNGLNGFIFNIDNPPVIDKNTGERGYPAQLINCKCRLVPVVEM